jgi:predicted cupin superfamily sugar epimerase
MKSELIVNMNEIVVKVLIMIRSNPKTETFRSDIVTSSSDNDKKDIKRYASTAIYFLVIPGNVSRLHRIKSDEGNFIFNDAVYYFY